MNLSILYRGPLSSCNYDCWYCPFAKRQESAKELATDREALERFVAWAEQHPNLQLRILFTPLGEALVRRWYQDALVRLTRLPHVQRAAIQTNLSCSLDWVDACDKKRLALWTTYHPGEIERPRFIAKCRELDRRGVRYSVGVVGLKEHADAIDALRPNARDIYLWINAYKDEAKYYREEDVRGLRKSIHCSHNNVRHASLGNSAGHRDFGGRRRSRRAVISSRS